MIQAIDLTMRYEDGLLALDALNLTVEAGEIFCLLGANGAGKTTTINLFLDFLKPTDGIALLDGIDAHRQPLEAKKRVAFLSENVKLYGTFTARQNLSFFARLSGQIASRRRIDTVLREVGLPDATFGKRVHTFSKGMRQKLGIAIAIIKDTQALLLDEPLSGLDPKAATELVAILKRLRDAGKAVLLSTHDIFRARELADHIAIMKEGRKVAQRSREELAYENLEALYLSYMRGGLQGSRETPIQTAVGQAGGGR